MQTLVLWLVCAEAVAGSLHPILKGCSWCWGGAAPRGGNHKGHGSSAETGLSPRLGWGRLVVSLTRV